MHSSVRKELNLLFVIKYWNDAYVLRNTRKQLKIANYGRKKSFLDFYLVYNGVCLKILESL